MNKGQIEGIIRSVIIAMGGVTGAAGWLNSVDWAAVAGAAATIGGLIWSLWSNSTKSVVAQAAASKEVVKVVTSPEIADAVPSPKVVALI